MKNMYEYLRIKNYVSHSHLKKLNAKKNQLYNNLFTSLLPINLSYVLQLYQLQPTSTVIIPKRGNVIYHYANNRNLNYHYSNTCAVCASAGCWTHIDIAYAAPHCKTPQYSKTFIPLAVSLRDDLGDPVFGAGLAGFKRWENAFSWA